jgi:hypothetical protein
MVDMAATVAVSDPRMKLRIKGDSIRLRLKRPEVEALLKQGAVRELTHLPSGAVFGYELHSDPRATDVTAGFERGYLSVIVPERQARAWSASEDVAIRALLSTVEGNLSVLIEKDFPCLVERPFEDDRGAFPRDQLKVDT